MEEEERLRVIITAVPAPGERSPFLPQPPPPPLPQLEEWEDFLQFPLVGAGDPFLPRLPEDVNGGGDTSPLGVRLNEEEQGVYDDLQECLAISSAEAEQPTTDFDLSLFEEPPQAAAAAVVETAPQSGQEQQQQQRYAN